MSNAPKYADLMEKAQKLVMPTVDDFARAMMRSKAEAKSLKDEDKKRHMGWRT